MHNPIGIFGGTFDPIHLGHLNLAKESLYQLSLQEIRFIPCYQAPLKHPPIATPEQRLAMLKLALEDYSQFTIDEREIERQGISYTVDTLTSLKAELPTTPLYLILSTESFANFHNWHNWQQIIKLAHIIVANRPNSPTITNPILVNLKNQFIKIPANPISATNIRKLIQENKDISGLVPKKVADFIYENKIYGDRPFTAGIDCKQ